MMIYMTVFWQIISKHEIKIEIGCQQHRLMIVMIYYTNQDLYRIPGHATQAKAGLSGTWAEADRPMPRCTWEIRQICFITYIFLFHSSVGLVGNFAGLPPCTAPPVIVLVIRMRLVIKQSNLPACLAEVQLEQSSWRLSGIYVTGLVKLIDTMDEI